MTVSTSGVKADGRRLVCIQMCKFDCHYMIYAITVNAASKGHLPVVLYLVYNKSADPFIRNNLGETAYDIAAAVFEVWICEVNQCFFGVRYWYTIP